jgi:hypothetical protein
LDGSVFGGRNRDASVGVVQEHAEKKARIFLLMTNITQEHCGGSMNLPSNDRYNLRTHESSF